MKNLIYEIKILICERLLSLSHWIAPHDEAEGSEIKAVVEKYTKQAVKRQENLYK